MMHCIYIYAPTWNTNAFLYSYHIASVTVSVSLLFIYIYVWTFCLYRPVWFYPLFHHIFWVPPILSYFSSRVTICLWLIFTNVCYQLHHKGRSIYLFLLIFLSQVLVAYTIGCPNKGFPSHQLLLSYIQHFRRRLIDLYSN